MLPKLASNLWSSCLTLLSARITDEHHHTWLQASALEGSLWISAGEKNASFQIPLVYFLPENITINDFGSGQDLIFRGFPRAKGK